MQNSAMDNVDLNLLPALDALLDEGSVTGAARRLGLSASAMSRTLARLRSVTGDPLLVRAGRGLVPTPRAAELRDRVHELTREALTVLGPRSDQLDTATLDRTFTIRANEGFVGLFSARLVAAVAEAAPRVHLRFAPKAVKDTRPLREGEIDLEIGVLGGSFPGQIRGRGAYGTSAACGTGDPGKLCRVPACRRFAQRNGHGASRRGSAGAWPHAGDRRCRTRLPRRLAYRTAIGSGCAGAAVMSRPNCSNRRWMAGQVASELSRALAWASSRYWR